MAKYLFQTLLCKVFLPFVSFHGGTILNESLELPDMNEREFIVICCSIVDDIIGRLGSKLIFFSINCNMQQKHPIVPCSLYWNSYCRSVAIWKLLVDASPRYYIPKHARRPTKTCSVRYIMQCTTPYGLAG